jgi:hypothetical protein
MPTVAEEVPPALRPAADAALDWINRERGARFRITGIVDPDASADPAAGQPVSLSLVLCDGDVCLREQVRVAKQGGDWAVRPVEAEGAVIPPELDPPAGVRSRWLDEQLSRHAFVALVFYRGFW